MTAGILDQVSQWAVWMWHLPSLFFCDFQGRSCRTSVNHRFITDRINAIFLRRSISGVLSTLILKICHSCSSRTATDHLVRQIYAFRDFLSPRWTHFRCQIITCLDYFTLSGMSIVLMPPKWHTPSPQRFRQRSWAVGFADCPTCIGFSWTSTPDQWGEIVPVARDHRVFRFCFFLCLPLTFL